MAPCLGLVGHNGGLIARPQHGTWTEGAWNKRAVAMNSLPCKTSAISDSQSRLYYTYLQHPPQNSAHRQLKKETRWSDLQRLAVVFETMPCKTD